MDTVAMKKFKDNIDSFLQRVVDRNVPVKVTTPTGQAVVVISAKEWEQEQATLHVLQDTCLMKQIEESRVTHQAKRGYIPDEEQMNEIFGI